MKTEKLCGSQLKRGNFFRRHSVTVYSLLVLLFAVVVCWVFSLWMDKHFNDLTKQASFGEQFGVVSALFSGLAFAGIIISIYVQRKEFEKQHIEIEKQQFVSIIFKLFDYKHKLVDDLTLWASHPPSKGSVVLEVLYDDMGHKDSLKHTTPEGFLVILDGFYKEHKGIIEHCFNNIFIISKIIHSNPTLSADEKRMYFEIFGDQLYRYELVLLFYYLIMKKSSGNPRFRDLAKQYALLKNLDETLLINKERDKDMFNN